MLYSCYYEFSYLYLLIYIHTSFLNVQWWVYYSFNLIIKNNKYLVVISIVQLNIPTMAKICSWWCRFGSHIKNGFKIFAIKYISACTHAPLSVLLKELSARTIRNINNAISRTAEIWCGLRTSTCARIFSNWLLTRIKGVNYLEYLGVCVGFAEIFIRYM